jgi:AcrR family transcriptional regulator
MVQNEKGRRGRPRAYDPDTVLGDAMAAFWSTGYGATSLDDLSAATKLNRPSLYVAFGDKSALYLRTLERYRDEAAVGMGAALAPARPLREGLRRVYGHALDLYFFRDPALGCYMIGTATTEAVQREEVRMFLRDALRQLDRGFERRLALAREQGEIAATADPASLAKIASAILHTLAVRSRAGDDRAELEAIVETGIALICGP